MITLTHPTLPGVTIEVAEADSDAWAAQGWKRPRTRKTRAK